MPTVTSRNELRACQKLPFCYLCGCTFGESDERDRDHVPPKKILAKADRDPPLILPTHPVCNEARSAQDELLGQLIAVLHGKFASPKALRLDLCAYRMPGQEEPTAVLRNARLEPMIWSWVKGFHAALYGQFLADVRTYNIHLPFPRGREEEGKPVFEPISPLQPLIVTELKKNQCAGSLDRVVCYGGKCRYECTWVLADRGEWLCMFGLRLYDWERLGRTPGQPVRGCVGVYHTSEGPPPTATVGTRLEFPVRDPRSLDPFAG